MWRVIVAVVALSALAVPAFAQPRDPRWEIEVYGGASLPNPPSDPVVTLPPTGTPLTTSSPIFPSRAISSWFFGDGADLLNDVNAAFALAPRVAPLDDALGELDIGGDRSGLFGVRVRRALSSRVFAEFSVESASGSMELPAALADAGEAARGSFETAFRALVTTGPFSNVAVSATRAVQRGSLRELSATAALNVRFNAGGGLEPYLTFGGGVHGAAGTAPVMSLEGTYRFDVANTFNVNETDRAAVRLERSITPVAVLGGGVWRGLSDRWGLRVDGRLTVGPGGYRLLIDADPTVRTSGPASFIESFTHPSIQFSNDPATGRRSSLSGPTVTGFRALEQDGLGTRFTITAGVTVRFN